MNYIPGKPMVSEEVLEEAATIHFLPLRQNIRDVKQLWYVLSHVSLFKPKKNNRHFHNLTLTWTHVKLPISISPFLFSPKTRTVINKTQRRCSCRWVMPLTWTMKLTWSALLEELVEVQRGGPWVGLLGSRRRGRGLLCFFHRILKRCAGVGPGGEVVWAPWQQK